MHKALGRTKIEPAILILFMALGLLPMCGGTFVLISGARNSHREISSIHVSQLAGHAQATLSRYLQRMIVQVATIGTVPAVRSAVLRSNPRKVTSEEEEIESEWAKLDANKSVRLRDLLGNSVSRFLRDYTQIAPSFREIIVTDLYGRVVAATNKTSDYFQADERWWAYAYREGAGGHFLGDIYLDKSAGIYAIEIAEPIMDPTTNTAVGVVKGVLKAQEIFGLVNSVDVGRNGYAALMRGDGAVIVSHWATVTNQEHFPHFEEIRAAATNKQSSVVVGEGRDRLFVGLPRSRLVETYPELDWYLIAHEPYDDAFAGFAELNKYYTYVILVSILGIGALSMFFSRILSRPVIETDPHLEKL
ncbi:MAG: cache domain-containing protein [Acidobacteriota bacterium]